MVKYVAWAIAVQSALLTTCAVGQGHSDVAFSYVEGKIDVEPPNGSTDRVFESNFPTSGIEQQLATLPGFASETDVGLGIGAGDEIVYNYNFDLEKLKPLAAESTVTLQPSIPRNWVNDVPGAPAKEFCSA